MQAAASCNKQERHDSSTNEFHAVISDNNHHHLNDKNNMIDFSKIAV